MPRPSKRPRLHFLGSISPDPDGELAIARARNDGLLKTRWENIFERYERDFEGIGDEISMLDNKIVVDNGHIRSMQNARDTGVTRSTTGSFDCGSKYDGRSILRAMTAAPSDKSEELASDTDTEEVFESIETIADNIIINEESSEDELFNVTSPQNLEHCDTPNLWRGMSSQEPDIKSEFETDDLFDTRPIMRSPSVDDLFDPRTPFELRVRPRVTANDPKDTLSTSGTPETSLYSLPSREIINRDIIREEIRKALEEENQTQEEKIEPAWRIPVRLSSVKTPSLGLELSRPMPVEPSPLESEDENDFYGDISAWQAPIRARKTKREVAVDRHLRRLRAESEDPLQDGFTSEAEEASGDSSISNSLSQPQLSQSPIDISPPRLVSPELKAIAQCHK